MYALTTHQLQVERRESHRDNQVYALTTHQLQVERRESHRDNQVFALTTHQLQVERRESHRDNQVYALTTHQLQVERRESQRQSSVCAHHTPATGGEERGDIETIKCMHSPHTSYRWRGERVIERDDQVYALTTHQLQVERRGESHRANQVYALTTHQLQVERRERHRANQCMLSPHTSYRWTGERDIETIKCMRSPHQLQVDRRERHRDNQVYALTTPATGGEERET